MYKISEIANIFNITTKTIRFYEEKGLLAPAKKDTFNNYRYYNSDAVVQLAKILQLKELGFTLHEISDTLNYKSTYEDKYNHLLKQRALIEYQIQQYHSYFSANPYQIYFNSEPITYYVEKEVQVHGYAELFASYNDLVETIIKSKYEFRPPYPFCATPIDNNLPISKNQHLKLSIPVSQSGSNSITQEESVYLYTIHHGPYDTIHKAYEFLDSYIQKEHPDFHVHPMECYLTHMLHQSTSPSDYVTQVRYLITT